MSVSAVAPTPFYQDPERLPIGLPQASSGDKADGAAQSDGKRLSMFAEGDDSPSFWDLLDVINPLQHIPVVSDIYRDMTGDKIGVGARLVGGTLFGGPIGLIASAVDCVVEESTGKDTGEHVLALFRDEGQSSPGDAPASQFAQAPANDTSAAPAAAANAVSSSPAAAEAAPVFALPDGQVTGASQPMVFSLDGVQPGGAQVAANIDANAALAQAQAQVQAQERAQAQAMAAGKPLPLVAASTKGFMPVPPRAAPGEIKAPPQITVPVSNSTARSNMPVTGRPSQNASAIASAPRAPVSQESLPGQAAGQTASSPDWFSAAWGQALDKYERANQRNAKPTTGTTTSTLE
ncbi:MAG: hypothetical protein ACM31D_18085 [Bacteroidota bacterium]